MSDEIREFTVVTTGEKTTKGLLEWVQRQLEAAWYQHLSRFVRENPGVTPTQEFKIFFSAVKIGDIERGESDE